MIKAINFCDESYSMSAMLNLMTAKIIGHINYVKTFTINDIDIAFREQYKNILSQKRGHGYWLWKPYIILKELQELDMEDYLVYADSGTFYMRNIKEAISYMAYNHLYVYIGGLPDPEYMYTKRDGFCLLGLDSPEYVKTPQFEASFLIIKKCEHSISFISKWLSLCTKPELLTDMPNICGKENYQGFIDHRHDQSLLSLLAKQEKINWTRGLSTPDRYNSFFSLIDVLFPDRKEITSDQAINILYTQTPEYKRNNCKQIFVHTRRKNCNLFIFVFKTSICIIKFLVRNYYFPFTTKLFCKLYHKRLLALTEDNCNA